MTIDDKELDFMQQVAKKIADRSRQSPISKEEVFDLFQETWEEWTTVRIVEVPVFMPFQIEKEKDEYVARCHIYRMCKGFGDTEEEAIAKLKEDIELYNSAMIESEKKMRLEEMIKNTFSRDSF